MPAKPVNESIENDGHRTLAAQSVCTGVSPASADLPVGRFVSRADQMYRRAHRRLFDYWNGVRAAPDRLPARRDIDPGAITDLLPQIWMTDVIRGDGAPRFRERLVGSEMTALYGRETTGRFFEEIYDGVHLRRQMATFRAIVAAAQPHLSRLEVPFEDRSFLVYDRLILPLAEDGKTPTILLGIHAYDPVGDEDPTAWPRPDISYSEQRPATRGNPHRTH